MNKIKYFLFMFILLNNSGCISNSTDAIKKTDDVAKEFSLALNYLLEHQSLCINSEENLEISVSRNENLWEFQFAKEGKIINSYLVNRSDKKIYLLINHEADASETKSDLDIDTYSKIYGVAYSDAIKVKMYKNLEVYKVVIYKTDIGWHVEYRLKSLNMRGGGPHYIIDPKDYEIIDKAYYQ